MGFYDDNSGLIDTAIAGTAAVGGGLLGGPAGVAAGLSATGPLITYLHQSGGADKAQAILKAAQDSYGKVDDASVQAAAKQILGPTGLASIQADPAYRAIQDQTLARLSQQSRTGLTLSDKAALNDTLDAAGAQQNRARQSIEQNFASRGMGGSGVELAAQLQGAQSGANTANQNARAIAGNASDRALQALMARTNLAGGLEDTDYRRKAGAASAQDRINEFNNTAQYQRAQQMYQNQLQKAGAQYGFAQQNAGLEEARANAAGKAIGGAVGGIGKGVGEYAAAQPTAAAAPAAPAPDYTYGGPGSPTQGPPAPPTDYLNQSGVSQLIDETAKKEGQ